MPQSLKPSLGSVFRVFLRLGLVAFGGPVAHLGYFYDEFVVRRRWLTERAYADLVALCQLLPGPASSQVGMAIGAMQRGFSGAAAAWLGFTAPSAVLLLLFAHIVTRAGDLGHASWLHGLKVVAVAVVAQAVLSMAQMLCPDRRRGAMAVASAVIALTWPATGGQLLAIALGGIGGLLLIGEAPASERNGSVSAISRRSGMLCLVGFILLLAGLPMLVRLSGSHALDLVRSFYQTGSLVFGGGHVVLPLLQAEVVRPGWVDRDLFLAGYGAVQAVPGPLFTFSAYLGAVMAPPPNGLWGALLCLVAIFLPSFLLVLGALPFWAFLRSQRNVRRILAGVNASVVGLLLAALYDPVWSGGIVTAWDVLLALGAFVLLVRWRLPSWLVVVLVGGGGYLIA